MPKKQTRESIEAELNASETERILRDLEQFKHDAQEFEADLQRLERERGLPVDPTKPWHERMAALGVQAADISDPSDVLDKIRLGRMDELPEDVRRRLAEGADAEISALDQLQDVLDARRRLRNEE